MGLFDVEWKSHEYHPDGRKRSRPPASSVHGWIAKWRGTFSGDEKLRSTGMREMREAAARRHGSSSKAPEPAPAPAPRASPPKRSNTMPAAPPTRRPTTASASGPSHRPTTAGARTTPAPPTRRSTAPPSRRPSQSAGAKATQTPVRRPTTRDGERTQRR